MQSPQGMTHQELRLVIPAKRSASRNPVHSGQGPTGFPAFAQMRSNLREAGDRWHGLFEGRNVI
jgi:hypothetical protein